MYISPNWIVYFSTDSTIFIKFCGSQCFKGLPCPRCLFSLGTRSCFYSIFGDCKRYLIRIYNLLWWLLKQWKFGFSWKAEQRHWKFISVLFLIMNIVLSWLDKTLFWRKLLELFFFNLLYISSWSRSFITTLECWVLNTAWAGARKREQTHCNRGCNFRIILLCPLLPRDHSFFRVHCLKLEKALS
jgi:hypothetical protein